MYSITLHAFSNDTNICTCMHLYVRATHTHERKESRSPRMSWSAECLLAAVAHVEEAIVLIFVWLVHTAHQLSCSHSKIAYLKLQQGNQAGQKQPNMQSSPVWGNVLLTNTNSAIPGDRCNLERSMKINCPTGMSHGTRYLQSPLLFSPPNSISF